MDHFKKLRENVGYVGPMQPSAAAPMAAGQARHDEACIAGVDLSLFAEITRGLADDDYGQSKAVAIAGARGISPEDWRTATVGWKARLQADPALAQAFSRLDAAR